MIGSSPIPPLEVPSAIAAFKEKLNQAAAACGRAPDEVRFILVTKTVPAEKILQAAGTGVFDFGENRVQELLAKKKEIGDSPEAAKIRWHMIGHLQTNKVRQVVGEVVMIHSLDRLELADEIERQAVLQKIPQVDCLIQVNSSGESSKFGLMPEEAADFTGKLKGPAIRIRGLMTVGPLTDDIEKVRSAFRRIKELQSELKKKYPQKDWGILSMGMSGDYPEAVREGANLLRIGSAVFGARK
jgi:PLP dependent protein